MLPKINKLKTNNIAVLIGVQTVARVDNEQTEKDHRIFSSLHSADTQSMVHLGSCSIVKKLIPKNTLVLDHFGLLSVLLSDIVSSLKNQTILTDCYLVHQMNNGEKWQLSL